MSIVTGWITDRMGFNPINPFNGQLKNGTLNGVRNVKCEQTLMLRLYLWIWIAFYLWNKTEDKVSVAKRVRRLAVSEKWGALTRIPSPASYFWPAQVPTGGLQDSTSGKSLWLAAKRSAGVALGLNLRNALRADGEGLFTRPVKGHCFSHCLKWVEIRQKDQRCRWQK